MKKSDNTRYGTVAVTIHWLSALLIIEQFVTGFWATRPMESAAKADLLWFHAPLGNAVLVLTFARLVWWWRYDTKPAPVGSGPKWQERIAKLVHSLFYITILGMAASGIAMIALSGADAIIFDGVPGELPDFNAYLPRDLHGFGARLMLVLLILHTGAVLHHHLIKKDVTLGRMWFG